MRAIQLSYSGEVIEEEHDPRMNMVLTLTQARGQALKVAMTTEAMVSKRFSTTIRYSNGVPDFDYNVQDLRYFHKYI
ncbi:unnamed protein product [Hermetia illucens]|uniref:Uncharacterized protein n=1 Tax=Hermetia illucens TaxID=343691 RepID=A0A7R8YT75_HERIL|nr:unnamed protein product [Hermetia illucens]